MRALMLSAICVVRFLQSPATVSIIGYRIRAAIAQLVERVTCNHKVSGSIPGGGFARLAQSDSAPDF